MKLFSLSNLKHNEQLLYHLAHSSTYDGMIRTKTKRNEVLGVLWLDFIFELVGFEKSMVISATVYSVS